MAKRPSNTSRSSHAGKPPISVATPRRSDTYNTLKNEILLGKLAPGEGIRELAVAKKLGVSRTPLREALFRLEREGLVKSVMNQGFFISPFSVREIREYFPLVASLEGLAVRWQGGFIYSATAELTRINNTLKLECNNPKRWLERDNEWHVALVKNCSNRKLTEVIEQLRPLVRRAQSITQPDHELLRISVEQHAGITSALKGGVIDLALELLERHWNYWLQWLLHRLGEV